MTTTERSSFFVPNTDTVSKVAAILVRQPTPWILMTLFIIHAVAWVAIPHWTHAPNHWGWTIFLIATLKFFLEWIIHGNVQHPARGVLIWVRRIMPRGPAQGHRRHHANPADLEELFFPKQTTLAALLAAWIVYGPFWLISPRVALAAITYAIGKAWWIDVIHFVIHTEWKPCGPFGWLIRRCQPRHGQHHGYGKLLGFAKAGNAAMWLELTSAWALADHLFGTTGEVPWWKSQEWWARWADFRPVWY